MRGILDPSRRRSRKTQEKEDVERWQQTVATTMGVHKCCFSCVVHSWYSSICSNIVNIAKIYNQTILKLHGKWHGNRCFFSHRWFIFLSQRVWKRLHGPLLHATDQGVMRSKDSKGQLLISYLACHPGNFHFNGSVQHLISSQQSQQKWGMHYTVQRYIGDE